MGQLINFKDFNPKTSLNANAVAAFEKRVNEHAEPSGLESEDVFKLTLNILIHNHPGKECFTLKEVSEKISVGEEFIRRRIKSGKIKPTYFGDKPLINIVELARIIAEGV